MNTRLLCVPLQILSFFFLLPSRTGAQGLIVEPADLIVIHGRVYTENPAQPWAQALATRGGKIVAIGDDAVIERRRGMGTRVINAGGKLVLPGFADCHVHFLEGSLSLAGVNLERAKNPSDIQNSLREYASEHPGAEWILGRGWNYAMFSPETLPHKKYLDELFPNRPILLLDYAGHAAWANSKALSIAGIIRETPNPQNGIIVRDPQTGEATGVLKEAAQDLVSKVVPEATRAEKLKALGAGMKWANEHGITRIHSVSASFEILNLFDEMRHRGDLNVRVYMAYSLNPPQLRPRDVDAIEAARKKFRNDWIDAGAVELMIDSVVESHMSAILKSPSDDPAVKSNPFGEPADYTVAVTELDKRGFQLFTHTVGDYGVRMALDAYEHAEQHHHKRDRRPRIEQIEAVAAADISRFGKLGVIASVQPLRSYPDSDARDVAAHSVGPEQTSRGWAWKSILDTGGSLAFGSDWPVVTLNPWEGIQTAVTGQTSEGIPVSGFITGERLTVEQAVNAYTLGAAFAGRREKTEGSLEAGKLADLIIVSQNIFDINPHKIGATRVLTAIVGGRLVYQADPK
jgi:predicted amidohydrolase YtcJ